MSVQYIYSSINDKIHTFYSVITIACAGRPVGRYMYFQRGGGSRTWRGDITAGVWGPLKAPRNRGIHVFGENPAI